MSDVTIDFVTDVTYDTVKRFKRNLAIPRTGMLIYNNIRDTVVSQIWSKGICQKTYENLSF
jgi:hypothetical protein